GGLRGYVGWYAERHVGAVTAGLGREPETLTLGGVEFGLCLVRGGETVDGLLVHLPARGVVFTGDVIMPYLGARFLPEGWAEGLFETMSLVRQLEPRLLIHGHTPPTERVTIDAL